MLTGGEVAESGGRPEGPARPPGEFLDYLARDGGREQRASPPATIRVAAIS
jgi:hypothetical protein